ncbi:MAG: 4'-phosphopantetheinyl transferase superfamily protein [Gemmataceae bacterium]|nr:4'-phosphopantetheinyl transferase superfamily protein [Gemmataceae bacterium]
MKAMNLIETTLDRVPIPPPGADEVHVWRFPLVVPTIEVLSSSERVRAARYAIDRPREQFRAARTALRRILGGYLGIEPRDVPLTVEPDGKPVLAEGRLQFNVTHSGERGLVAVANRRVGVDLEQLRPVENADGLVERFFGPDEREQYRRLPVDLKLAGFFRGWTGKEALLKAVGTGIQNVDKCVVDLDPRNAPRIVRFDHAAESGEWRLLSWEPEQGYLASMAIESETPFRWR